MPSALEQALSWPKALGPGIMGGVRRNIVEGEPGIFPDPIARLIRLIGRAVGRLFRRRPPPEK